ncbi:VOC family protein [Sulfitobacter donghicola]|uniref:Dioxygenase n=1 Tax=Sulfitobacter donghicola DSW-25 = KCTC 12864 = JCM 14565 TaxID=1300350 RepID=A0A073IH57_9RHOB|nr:VOC family protein [Sulfitobacter donghicola]KEJ89094.1 dioxygenase [Sulfitobacter donghicola DSW-25 = KCTC 12864 = JCM 14565]KIN67330.1 Glyoxalase/bleomycin resistance protein/dioxygenase [Sulfitobacter donghicola DSW-25 = KCTC 12864 = JCM 14565]
MSIFHFAFNVTDLEKTRAFYGGVLGCAEGRSTDTWVDFDFFGHQLSCHLGTPFQVEATGLVGEHKVPMPHFGVVLPYSEWRALADKLESLDLDFVLKPQTRFAGQPGEQSTMFFMDPSGNPIEVKGLADMDGAFAT